MERTHVPDVRKAVPSTECGDDHTYSRCLASQESGLHPNLLPREDIRYVGIHRTHFSKTFTEHIGIPPVQYLQNVRMNKAIQLLQHTSFSETDIALSVDYLDLVPFTRAFTKQYGQPPRRSRNK